MSYTATVSVNHRIVHTSWPCFQHHTASTSRNYERQLGFDVVLANEHEVEDLFEDCSPGAIPPIGECYGLDVVVDESVVDQPEVYLEAGDHETLVHLRRDQFARLMETARRERFSTYYCNEKSAVTPVERVMHKAVTWVSPDTPIVSCC